MNPFLKAILLLSFFFLAKASIAKSQLGGDSAFLHFSVIEKMSIYLDSLGKFEMTECWEVSNEKITLDIYGNRFKIEGAKSNSRTYILGIKGKKYGSSGFLKIIPFYECTDYLENRCNIRLMLQSANDLNKAPSYLYIDYKNMSQVYKIYLK